LFAEDVGVDGADDRDVTGSLPAGVVASVVDPLNAGGLLLWSAAEEHFSSATPAADPDDVARLQWLLSLDVSLLVAAASRRPSGDLFAAGVVTRRMWPEMTTEM
jgi:hypothetical protein